MLNRLFMKRLTFLSGAVLLLPMRTLARLKLAYMRATKGFKVATGESRSGAHWKMKGVTLNLLDLKIAAADTAGAIAMFEQTGFTPKGGPPLHVHPHQDEWFYILEGQYRFQCGDDTFELNTADTIFLPRNVPHAFVQLSEKAKVLVTYQPAGKMEQFFKITNTWTAPPAKEEIAAVFEACDMKVAGPPLKAD